MFSFFKKKNLVRDISWLGVDMHSHLLPGIDDGAKDLDTSLNYIRSLTELGYNRLICTPHILQELYPNSIHTINPALKLVKEQVSALNISINIDAAAEYMIDEDFNMNTELMLMDNKYILIEMSYLNESPDIDKTIFELQVKGLIPVLAHPERYTFYFKDQSRLRKFKQSGCLLQLNLLSVAGYYGKEVKALSQYLLQENLYDLAGTDLHHDKHLKLLKESVQNGDLYTQIGHYPFLNKEIFN